MALERPEERKAQRPKEFKARHGYMPLDVPKIWVGQTIALNIVTGVSGYQLGVMSASGVLEAVPDDGYVISVEDRVVFYPKHAVVHIELHRESAAATSSTGMQGEPGF